MKGVDTGDYSGATRDAQMLYSPEIGGKVDYDKLLVVIIVIQIQLMLIMVVLQEKVTLL